MILISTEPTLSGNLVQLIIGTNLLIWDTWWYDVDEIPPEAVEGLPMWLNHFNIQEGALLFDEGRSGLTIGYEK